jgi:hypothetical protein
VTQEVKVRLFSMAVGISVGTLITVLISGVEGWPFALSGAVVGSILAILYDIFNPASK